MILRGSDLSRRVKEKASPRYQLLSSEIPSEVVAKVVIDTALGNDRLSQLPEATGSGKVREMHGSPKVLCSESILRSLVLLCFIWFCNSAASYGQSTKLPSLHMDRYVAPFACRTLLVPNDLVYTQQTLLEVGGSFPNVSAAGKSATLASLTNRGMAAAEPVKPWIAGFETEGPMTGGFPAIRYTRYIQRRISAGFRLKHDDDHTGAAVLRGAGGQVQLRPCGEANATGRQNWTVNTDATGLIGLAGADLWLALSPRSNGDTQPVVVLSRNQSNALKFEFLPAGRGQRGAEVWIRTAETVSGTGELLCLDDFSSAPRHPSRLPVGGVFLGGCDDMSGAETWVALGAEHWSTRNKPKWLVCGSTDDEQCLTAAPAAISN